MFRRISQILLLSTLLLIVFGNTVKLGVCPCHQGFFFGDCECNLRTCEELQQASSETECTCGSPHHHHHDASHQHDEQEPSLVEKSSHCSGDCNNVTLETKEPFLFASSVKCPETDQNALIIAVPFEHDGAFIPTEIGLESDPKLRPPPDLYRDSRFVYTGFMRPALA